MASSSSHLLGDVHDHQFIKAALNAANRQRLSWLLAIFAVIHLVHIALFWPYSPGAAENADLWRNGIIAVHAAFTLFIGLVLPFNLRADKGGRADRVLHGTIPHLVSLVYLLGGATLAVIDQRVTSSITPLLAAAIGVPLVVVIPPPAAVINYLLMLACFQFGVGWTQVDKDLLLTIRVNAITAAGLGCGLAVIQWRNQTFSLRQQRQIEAQQRELQEKNRVLTLLATRDPMTGLLNRSQFILDANSEIGRMQRAGHEVCLIMIDIDEFKRINDTFGHPAGDSILRQVAGTLSGAVRSTDLLSRFGGEEFAVLLPVGSLQEAVQVAEDLRTVIAEQSFAVGQQSLRITASFGVAQCPTGSAEALDEAYRAADLALYQSKNDGRNLIRIGPLPGQAS